MDAGGMSRSAVELRSRLLAPLDDDPDFWTMAANSRRTMGHALFNYPAMMVPQVQGALLDAWIESDAQHHLVFDPFAGSGTVMTESMFRGLDFRGSDINPLALLLLHVKTRPLTERRLRKTLDEVLTRVSEDKQRTLLPLRGRDKWFGRPVALQLTRLHRAISLISGRSTRLFFWVCLASTVRQVSNSRTSTFKLHVYAPEVLEMRSPDALADFECIARESILDAALQRNELQGAGLLSANGHYLHKLQVMFADVRTLRRPQRRADLLMTSPPYGDNRTTVPYGQYAFLPLSWIDPADLDGGSRLTELLANPYRTDVASLGGKAAPAMVNRLSRLTDQSEAVRETYKRLRDLPGDGLRRFSTFVCDLDEAMARIGRQMRPGAFQFWTLGERSISGHRIPTTRIVAELAALRGHTEVVTLARAIPDGRKRMAIRNDSVGTIRAESILVLQGCFDSTVAAAPQPTP